MDLKLAFVQNMVGPFARLNGALAVVNPEPAPEQSVDGLSTVEVFDERGYHCLPK